MPALAARRSLSLLQERVDPREQLLVAALDAAEPLDDIPMLNVITSETSARASRGISTPSFTMRLLERFGEHRAPLGVHAREAFAQVGVVPSERLQLEPDLRTRSPRSSDSALLSATSRGRKRRRVHLALPRDHPRGEPLEGPYEEVLDGAEVVADEAVVDPSLLGQTPSGDARSAGVDEHALGCVEESLLRSRARRRLGHR